MEVSDLPDRVIRVLEVVERLVEESGNVTLFIEEEARARELIASVRDEETKLRALYSEGA